MSRSRVIAPILALVTISGCRIVLDDPVDYSSRSCADGTVAVCVEAANHSELSWIEANIFNKCTFSGCHNGASTAGGRLDLQPGKSHASIVGVNSRFASGPTLVGPAKIVTPGMPTESYLLVMLRQLAPAQYAPPLDPPPADIGYMPQGAGGAITCCQKLDAVQRWIDQGAQNN